MKTCLLCVAAAAVWLLPGRSSAFEPNVLPEMDVPRTNGKVTIDGELDEPAWLGAGRAQNWTETWPGDQVEPPVGTQTWVMYDDDHLYLAFLAEDDPGSVRASLRDRDEIWQDDYVGIILDTYGNASWAYELFVNPLGIQGDLRWTTQGEDMRFDMVWESKGKITEDGWQVEVAIPFKSLRFPNGTEQSWRATFWRNHPRDSRTRYSWARMNRDDPCWPCNFGTLRGIREVSSGSSWELLPSLTGFDVSELPDSDDPSTGLQGVNSDIDFGMGARYALTSSVSAEGTFNPDFSQVESDAAQIDVNTTFALFFPEQRPFFQEGSDLYDTWVSQVYTRSINNPQWAGKLTGRPGKNSFAFMSAQDEDSPVVLPFQESSEILRSGRSWSNIFRARRTFGEDNHIGFLGTDRRLEGGGSGSTFGLDAQVRVNNIRIEAQATGSYTEEPEDLILTADLGDMTFDGGDHTAAFDGESFAGNAGYFSVERDARRWNFDFDYWQYSPTFRADNGFVTQNDTRRTVFWTGWNWYPNNRILDDFSVSSSVGRIWNFDSIRKDEWVRPQVNFQFKRQTSMSAGLLFSEERFREKEFKGITRSWVNVNSNFSQPVQAGLYYERGKSIARNLDDPVLGDIQTLSLWGGIKPIQRLIIGPTLDYAKLDRRDGSNIFEGYVVRTRISLQFSRELFLRLVLQYNEFADRVDVEPLITYRVNPFTVFFAGTQHRFTDFGAPLDYEQTDRQYFAKFQYLFRI